MNENIPIEERRRKALRGIGPFLIFTVCFTLIAGYFSYRTFFTVQENSADPIAACQGLPITDVATYEEVPGVKPAVAYRQLENGQYILDNELILTNLRAPTTAQLEVVVCVGPQEPLTIPDCDIGDELIYGHQLTIELINAATGATIASTTLQTEEVTDADCLAGGELGEPRMVTNGEINNFLIPILDRR